MASNPMPPGATLLDAPAHAFIVECQRHGERPVFDSWHDTRPEAQAQVDFLVLDSKVTATIIPPPAKVCR